MHTRLAAVVLACSLLPACVEEPTVGSGSAEILGGTAATVGQYPTVVAVVNNGLCTGTLVGPDLVLTAAHCVSPSVLGYSSQAQVTAATSVVLDTVNVFGGGGQQIHAADTIPDPEFRISALGDNDIALIRLQSAVTDRTPSVINRIAGDAPPGIHVTEVGFGMTDVNNQNSAGRLYVLADKATRNCSGFEGSDLNLLCYGQTDGTGKCEGDSGGPSFLTVNGVQRVVGVTSFGDQNCTQFGADTRVDAETAFLFANAPELQCQADGICNQTCGNGTLPVDADCPVCDKDGDCGSDEICVAGQCQAAPFTPGGLGSECTSNADCDSGLCASDGTSSQCTTTCDAGGNSCRDGFACVEAGVCWAEEGGGGCQTSGHGAGGAVAWLLGLLGMVVVVRRRRKS